MPHDDLRDHCIELLQPLGTVRSRRMFGGHGFYLDGVFIALIAGDTLFVKTDDSTRPAFRAAGCEPFVYAAKGKPATQTSYWTVPADAMESAPLMAPWARLAMRAALATRARRAVRPRAAKSAKSVQAAAPATKAARKRVR
jgi:DNA transformation protein